MKISGDLTIGGTLSVEGWLHAPNLHHPCRGLYTDADSLCRAWPMPLPGWWALVGATCADATVWIAEARPMLPEAEWRDTGEPAPQAVIEHVIETIGETPVEVAEAAEADLEIADERGRPLVRFADGHIKTKCFDSSAIDVETPVETADVEEADLEIADEQGRPLVRFADGHIQTKNFDSSVIELEVDSPVETADVDGADLEIADEQGQVVLRVADGHIYTKRFSSEGGVAPGASSVGGVTSLNVLFISNSWGEDCLGYMPMLLQDILPGFEINLVIAPYSGAFPSQHVTALNSGAAVYSIYHYNGRTGKWAHTHSNVSCAIIRNLYRWDVVGYVGFYGETWEGDSGTPSHAMMPYVPQIFDWCRAHIPGSWRTAFVIPPPTTLAASAIAQMEAQHAAMRANAKRLMECSEIDDVVPCGTAVQNLRLTSPEIAALGSNRSLSDDGIHMSEGLPVLTTSYVSTLWALKVAGATTKTVRGNAIRPSVAWMDSHELMADARTGTCLGVTDENVTLAQKCALAAFKNPYEAGAVY